MYVRNQRENTNNVFIHLNLNTELKLNTNLLLSMTEKRRTGC